MIEFLIPFACGIFIGSLFTMFIIALITANGREDQEPDGVDDVLDEIMEVAKNQKTPICLMDEDRRKELLDRYKE